MHSDHKYPTVEHIDPLISAEIPNKNEDIELYTLVSDYMIHGPCGIHNIKCPCMIDKKCSKNFPKKFREHTSIDSSGFPLYRRRDSGYFVEKSGPDRVTVSVVENENEDDLDKPVDEIKQYYDCRYLSACEASWRILAYDVHYRYPSIIRLLFHLPNQQQVVYGADDDIDNVLNKPSVASSMFLCWMECNRFNEEAQSLTYVEFPTKFVWKQDQRCWAQRKKRFSIGRIHSVSPSLGEAYFLRILLNKVKGPKSFDDILTVNGHTFNTFRQACYTLGLLDDDMEYIEAIQEASHAGSGFYLRTLFATMLTSNSLSRPEFVWNKTWELLSDGILYKQRIILKAPGISPLYFIYLNCKYFVN
ncbi:hypothetical protein E3N88_29011 [Mikania micrantha]|uniref:Uncharacterized protein n=1 Tax=Mikania micrantha TaxID=192012 RepID=A0A5N6N2C2_9ASTR|nr:hypothetical protein E3N88_29011 [Mikania micrantha]